MGGESGTQGEDIRLGKSANERTQRFIKSGRGGAAAHKAAPRSKQEAHSMAKAERIGRSRAKR